VFGLNKEDLGRKGSLPCKDDIGLRLGRDMHQALSVTVQKLQEVSAAKVCVTCEHNYGVCYGEIDSHWVCLSLHNAVEPPFNTLGVKFHPFKIFVSLLSKCTSPKGNLKYGLHSHQICIYLNFYHISGLQP
jgi:hypothetical protein